MSFYKLYQDYFFFVIVREVFVIVREVFVIVREVFVIVHPVFLNDFNKLCVPKIIKIYKIKANRQQLLWIKTPPPHPPQGGIIVSRKD